MLTALFGFVEDSNIFNQPSSIDTSNTSTELNTNLNNEEHENTTGTKPKFEDGHYLIGEDIKPGTYFVEALSGCYWERQSSLSGELGSIIANDLVSVLGGQFVVTIKPGDKAFLSRNCGEWYSVDDIEQVAYKSIPDGVYLVGAQIKPGTYKASSPGEDCYWERMSNFSGEDGIIANDIGGSSIVSIRGSDKGFKSLNCGIWTAQ